MIKVFKSLSSRAVIAASIIMLIGASPTGASSTGASPASDQSDREEIAQLRAEIEQLLARVAELEARQQASSAEVATAVVPSAASAGASSAVSAGASAANTAATLSWRWSGDFRYRSESLDIDSAPHRQRDRIRARVGFTATVSEDVAAVLRIATSDGLDPRSANVTLSQLAERKSLGVELAYLRWQPGGADADWTWLAGKMPPPWQRSPSYFLDTDINPEGIAAQWQRGRTGPFASIYYFSLLERSAARDSTLWGAQLGWRWSEGTQVALGLFDYQAVEGNDPFLRQDPAAAFGNSLTTGSLCREGVTRCLAQDFQVLQGLIDYRTQRGALPIRLYGEFARNLAFDTSRARSTGGLLGNRAGDQAYALGITIGEARNAGGVEWGLVYQDIERDALFAPWLDADFGSGYSAVSGVVMRLGYALSPRWMLNATWFETERDLAPSFDRERGEQRLHLDMNARF